MIYLDTHIVVWLYSGRLENICEETKALMNEGELYVSPCVRLELQYLYEIKRINVAPDEILNDLSERIGLRICNKDFSSIIGSAMRFGWTRDPFDRIICAQAGVNGDTLVTKDQSILENYASAIW